MIRILFLIGWWFAPAARAEAPQNTEAPVKVMAAASLMDVLERIGTAFASETGHPRPTMTFGGSSTVARQVTAGADADLVILANTHWMDFLEARAVVDPEGTLDLLGNRLAVVVPRDSTLTPDELADLAAPEFHRIALARPEVPAGTYAAQALFRGGGIASDDLRVLRTPHVRGALVLTATGNADAALVYQTDAAIEPRVRTAFTVDPALHDPIRYPIAMTTHGQTQPATQAFFRWLQGSEARAEFHKAGFSHLGIPPVEDSPSRRSQTSSVDPNKIVARTLCVAILSVLVSLVPAIGLGWFMARRQFRGKALLSTLLLSPLVMPPVVTGWLLLQVLGHGGILGGLDLAFTRWAAVLAAAIVGFPLLLILTRSAIESVDPRFGKIAQTLGLTPWQAFQRVTLPMAFPGIAAGAVLAFARALGEFGATAMVAGDLPGETRTLALAVYALAERPGGESSAATLVWISLGLCLLALLLYERLVWRQRSILEDRP